MSPERGPVVRKPVTLKGVRQDYRKEHPPYPPSARAAREIAVEKALAIEAQYDPLLPYFSRLVSFQSEVSQEVRKRVLPTPIESLGNLDIVPFISISEISDWEQVNHLLRLSPFEKKPLPSSRVVPKAPEARGSLLASHLYELPAQFSAVPDSQIKEAIQKSITVTARLTTLDAGIIRNLHWYPGETSTVALETLRTIMQATFESWLKLTTSADEFQIAGVIDESLSLLNQLSENQWRAVRYDFPGKPENFVSSILYFANEALKGGVPYEKVANQFFLSLIARRTPLAKSDLLTICNYIKEGPCSQILPDFLLELGRFKGTQLGVDDYLRLGLTEAIFSSHQPLILAEKKQFSLENARIVYLMTGKFNPFHNRHLLGTIAASEVIKTLHGNEGKIVIQPWSIYPQKTRKNHMDIYDDDVRMQVCQAQLHGLQGENLTVTLEGQKLRDSTEMKFKTSLPQWLEKQGAPENIQIGRICGLEKISEDYPLTDFPHILLVTASDFKDLEELMARVKLAFEMLERAVIVILPCPEYRATALRKNIQGAKKGDETALRRVQAMLLEPAANFILEQPFP